MIIQNQENNWSAPINSKDQTPYSNNLLLTAVTSSWIDGVLLLTVSGEVVYSNRAGRDILARLYPQETTAFKGHLPKEIWQALQILKQNHNGNSDQPILFESDIKTDDQHIYRIRIRWFEFDESSQPHVLIILEDQYQAKYNLASIEVDKYQLSPREAEVWMLHRMGYRSKQIATELFISIHTVKKHLRNIRWKRDDIENRAVA